MSLPLGSPVQRVPLTITDTPQRIIPPHGTISITLQNTGANDCYYGTSTVNDTNGIILYSQGDRETFENIPSNFEIWVVCAATKTTTLRIADFK